MSPIAGIARIAAALERGEEMEPVCREVVAAVKAAGPHAPYLAPVADPPNRPEVTAEVVAMARAAR